MSTKSKGRNRLAIRYFDDRVLLTDTHAWAYYRVPSVCYEFTTSDGGPGWREDLDRIYQHVWAKDFWAKEIYLGVRLGQRSMRAQLTGGLFTQLLTTYRAAEKTLGIEDEAVPAGQGEQGRGPPAGACPRHGRAHQGGRRGGADRARGADRRRPDA